MTDRELLELAANAAGRVIEGVSPTKGLLLSQADGVCAWWNPLTTDGDALRLAVKLRIDVGYHDTNGHVRAHPRHGYILFTSEDYYAHPTIEAATRRAITRAAAEIGKAMP